jgi:hypothetical protein
VMNAQQCVDSQLIVEAPALMSMVHPYSISLTNHRKVTIRSLTSRSSTGDRSRLAVRRTAFVLCNKRRTYWRLVSFGCT